MEELLWFSEPKPLDLPRALFGDQNIARQIHQRCVPAREKPVAALESEREQPLFRRQAVIVEGVDAIRHVNVVAGKPDCGLDPSGAETEVRIAFQKRKRQDLASAVGEKVPIRPMPVPGRIILHVDLWEEHRAASLVWLQSGPGWTTQSDRPPSVREQVRACNIRLQ